MKKMKQTTLFTFLLAALFLGVVSCDTTDSNGNEGTAQFNVQLTDAPANYDAVFVDIEAVRIKPDDVEDIDGEADEDADDGWITINEEPARVDLLELRNGGTIQLGDEEVDAGVYNQIRLVLGPDNAVVIDGETYDLKTPSAQQSGLKLNIDAQLEDGEVYNLLVDFDAGRSIVETGNGMYILKPVLRAVELEATGSIAGMITPADVQTSVMATANGDTLSTITNEDGAFAIIGVNEGIYDVTFAPSSDVYADTTVTEVSVENETDTDLGTIILPEL